MSKSKTGLFSLGAVGCLTWIACAFLINTLLVLLVWNALGLHSWFGAGELSFLQGLAVAILLALVGV
jgi:hypothetical protein